MRFDEDDNHCFLKCKGVRQCWREMNVEMIRVRLLEKENSKEFVREILNFKLELSTKVFLLLWKWWAVRNKVNAGEQLLPCDLRGGD
jgi:hypothetical protein